MFLFSFFILIVVHFLYKILNNLTSTKVLRFNVITFYYIIGFTYRDIKMSLYDYFWQKYYAWNKLYFCMNIKMYFK